MLFSVLCKKEEEEQESKEEAAEEDKSVTQRGQEEEDLRSLVPSGVKMLRHMCGMKKIRVLEIYRPEHVFLGRMIQNTIGWISGLGQADNQPTLLLNSLVPSFS